MAKKCVKILKMITVIVKKDSILYYVLHAHTYTPDQMGARECV